MLSLKPIKFEDIDLNYNIFTLLTQQHNHSSQSPTTSSFIPKTTNGSIITLKHGLNLKTTKSHVGQYAQNVFTKTKAQNYNLYNGQGKKAKVEIQLCT
jgi:hypothetical protein